MFEGLDRLLAGRGGSSVDAAFRRLVDGLVFELDGPPHGRRQAPDVSTAEQDAELQRRADRLDARVAAGAEQLAAAQDAHREQARAAARQARALATFARNRPSSFDRPDTEIGAAAAATRAARPAPLAQVSEWAVDEVMVALSLSSDAATVLLVDSLRLVERLPRTLAALEAGRISWAHVRVMTDLVAPLTDGVRAVAEERLMARIEGRTHNQLRVAARRVVQRLDAAAVADRVRQAVRDRSVRVYSGDDGMSTLASVLPAPVARAVEDALRQYAEAAATDGDDRTVAQRMADCLVDLVLRPGEHGLAPVQARLTVVAAVETLLGSDEPGEVNGDLVPADVVRGLAEALGLTVDETEGAAGDVTEDVTEDATEDVIEQPAPQQESAGERPSAQQSRIGRRAGSATDRMRRLGELLRSGRPGNPALGGRPEIALRDELTGQLVALTDATGLIRGSGLGPPPRSPGYRPGARLDRFVRLRDRRCRFPGCRARPVSCDLDHTVPWPWGATSADNLSCLCRHHHRLSHQAPGWRLRGLPRGGLEWTTPGGVMATTRPPSYGADDDLLPADVRQDGSGQLPEGSPDVTGVGNDDLPPY